jgi:hypothetical protein
MQSENSVPVAAKAVGLPTLDMGLRRPRVVEGAYRGREMQMLQCPVDHPK